MTDDNHFTELQSLLAIIGLLIPHGDSSTKVSVQAATQRMERLHKKLSYDGDDDVGPENLL